jgi:hypothetical protein
MAQAHSDGAKIVLTNIMPSLSSCLISPPVNRVVFSTLDSYLDLIELETC